MDKRLLNGSEFGKLAGISRQAVSQARKKGKLVFNELNKTYDIKNSLNRLFLDDAQAIKESKEIDSTSLPSEPIQGDMRSKHEQKIDVEIRRISAMAERYEIQVAREKGELIPIELMDIWIGYFAEGIRNNFLTLGNKAARGDVELRNRIEKMVKASIEKTKEGAERGLRKYGKQLIENNATGGQND